MAVDRPLPGTGGAAPDPESDTLDLSRHRRWAGPPSISAGYAPWRTSPRPRGCPDIRGQLGLRYQWSPARRGCTVTPTPPRRWGVARRRTPLPGWRPPRLPRARAGPKHDQMDTHLWPPSRRRVAPSSGIATALPRTRPWPSGAAPCPESGVRNAIASPRCGDAPSGRSDTIGVPLASPQSGLHRTCAPRQTAAARTLPAGGGADPDCAIIAEANPHHAPDHGG
jgi:hypothetical protein